MFDFLGSTFGWILWFLFDITSNYAVAIFLFTLVINALLFPFSVKRQKSMAAQSKLASKQAELKKRCRNDVSRYNEELAKLYEKEGVNPLSAGGCTAMLVPLVLLMGIFGVIGKPLENALHIATDKVNQAMDILRNLPDIGELFKGNYSQLQLVRVFPQIQEHLTMFTPKEISAIEEYSSGFNFFGINLLSTPNKSTFAEMVWVIPVLALIFSILQNYLLQKGNNSAQTQGFMKLTTYMVPLLMAWLYFTTPAAVGLYWISNSIVMALQQLILNKFYNSDILTAKSEASRLAMLEIKEKQQN